MVSHDLVPLLRCLNAYFPAEASLVRQLLDVVLREAVYTPFSVTRVDGLSLIAVSPKVGVSYE